MQSEVRSNGSTIIRLAGERPIEKQALAEMLEAAAKGASIQILADGEVMVLKLEH